MSSASGEASTSSAISIARPGRPAFIAKVADSASTVVRATGDDDPVAGGLQERRRPLRLGQHPELVGRARQRPRHQLRIRQAGGVDGGEHVVGLPAAALPCQRLRQRQSRVQVRVALQHRRAEAFAQRQVAEPQRIGRGGHHVGNRLRVVAVQRQHRQPQPVDDIARALGGQPFRTTRFAVPAGPSGVIRCPDRVGVERMSRPHHVVDDGDRAARPRRPAPRRHLPTPTGRPTASGRPPPGTPTPSRASAGSDATNSRTEASSRAAVGVRRGELDARQQVVELQRRDRIRARPSSGSTVTISRTAPLTASWYTSVADRLSSRCASSTISSSPSASDSRAARSTAAVLPCVGNLDQTAQRRERNHSVGYRPGHPGRRAAEAFARGSGHRRLARADRPDDHRPAAVPQPPTRARSAAGPGGAVLQSTGTRRSLGRGRARPGRTRLRCRCVPGSRPRVGGLRLLRVGADAPRTARAGRPRRAAPSPVAAGPWCPAEGTSRPWARWPPEPGRAAAAPSG